MNYDWSSAQDRAWYVVHSYSVNDYVCDVWPKGVTKHSLAEQKWEDCSEHTDQMWPRRGRKKGTWASQVFLGCEGKPIQAALLLKLTPGCLISSCLFLLLRIRTKKPILVFSTVKENIAGLHLGQRAPGGQRNPGGTAYSLALLLSIKAQKRRREGRQQKSEFSFSRNEA